MQESRKTIVSDWFSPNHNEAHVYEQPFSGLQICTRLTYHLIKATATHLLLIRLDQEQTRQISSHLYVPILHAFYMYVIYVRYKVTLS